MKRRWTDTLPGIAAGSLAGAAGAMMLWRSLRRDFDFLRWPGVICCVLGAVLAAGGFVRAGSARSVLRAAAIVVLNTAALLGVVEIACRLGGVNFAVMTGERERFERFPVCFRMPTQPLPEVFFARPGPQAWTGRVLNTMLENLKSIDVAYPDEPEITVRYDKDGFRNPDDLVDWDIAVAGDSFTEAGYLPEEQMFTSVLAAKSGRRVKHLGVSYTGNFTQTAYLRRFGKSASTRQAVIAFFEGNDIEDDVRELRDLQRFRSAGVRPVREMGRETSFLRTLYLMTKNMSQLRITPRSYATAHWAGVGGSTPVSIYEAPPSPETLTAGQREAVCAALDEWSHACRDLGLDPWLLFLPCKARVLHGGLEFLPAASAATVKWTPGRLPEFIGSLCKERGIRFIDSTPPLAASCLQGVLTHNTIYDTHLNREGCRIVGELLAKSLSTAP
ncbi:MAG: hypothetical protein K1X78_11520 [Verrucomicrobiaceae bacterium]|nr:hypothetical protein [Verrucomicrobiaceae bacterium]